LSVFFPCTIIIQVTYFRQGNINWIVIISYDIKIIHEQDKIKKQIESLTEKKGYIIYRSEKKTKKLIKKLS